MKVLALRAVVMVVAGCVFASIQAFPLILIAATLGVVSRSGNEICPYLAIEQATLAQLVPGVHRTGLFAWYVLLGSMARVVGRSPAVGSLSSCKTAVFLLCAASARLLRRENGEVEPDYHGYPPLRAHRLAVLRFQPFCSLLVHSFDRRHFTGKSIDDVLETVDRINKADRECNRPVRIHAVGLMTAC